MLRGPGEKIILPEGLAIAHSGTINSTLTWLLPSIVLALTPRCWPSSGARVPPTEPNSPPRTGTALLPLLEQHLARDLPFDALERLERVLKLVVRDVCAASPSGPAARDLARFQQRVGLLFKDKS